MSKKMLLLKVKQFVPIFIGLWLGIAVSLMAAPFIDDSCALTEGDAIHQKQGSDDSFLTEQFGGPFRKTNSVGAASDPISSFDYGRSDEYEPRLKKADANVKTTPTSPSAERKRKLLRPRYASTELQVREKLFVGVLSTSKTIATLGLALNRTLAHTVPKLVFFLPQENAHVPSSMPIVLLPDASSKQMPFQMFDFIGGHSLKTYDWFYIMPDSTYVRGRKLHKMVKHTSMNQDVYIGNRTRKKGEERYCSFESGMLLSQNVMRDVINDLKWCRQNVNSGSLSEILGECVLHATGKECTNMIGSHQFGHYAKPKFDFERDVRRLRVLEPAFSHTLSVSGIHDEKTVYKLHRYFCELELSETKRALEEKKSYIVKLFPKVPTEKLTFPIGIDPPVKLNTRFDMIRWDYFTLTHIYIDSDASNMQELTGIHKKDIDEIMMVAMERINRKYNTHNTLQQLINGYRRFDPVRGMAYILDLELKSPKGKKVHKRVHLMRPLSQVEIVPMPYVTESSRVNLILPVSLSERDLVVSFLDSYAKTCLDAGDNTHLFVVFVYNVTTYHSDVDVFSVLKSMIAFYETKYQSGAHIAWTTVYARKPNQYTVMDAIARKFVAETLFLLCTVGMELSTEFLNRVRMNTIAGWQVFFPIAFWQYKPNLIYEEKPYPTMIEINKMVGHFDNTRYEHASFYNSDYQHARHLLASPASKLNSSDDLFDMFLKYHQVHVFRAVAPALKIRYRERTCNPMLNEDAYQRCIVGRAAGLASKSQLAMLIFEQQQKADQAHGNGPKQQNEPNSEQVKPNVIKKKKK